VKVTVIMAAGTVLLLMACSSGPSADEVSWGNLPDGTQEWITEAIEDDDCGPIRTARDHVAVFEEDEDTPSEAYFFLQDTFERMNCDQLSGREQLEELLTMDIGVDDVERLSGKEDNPLYYGPGCVGTIRTLGDVREPRPQDDIEGALTRLLLASSAILDSLPEDVTKTGTREPTASEDAAMRAAAVLLDLGNGLLSDSPDSGEQVQSAITTLENLEQQLNIACILEYDDGTSVDDA